MNIYKVIHIINFNLTKRKNAKIITLSARWPKNNHKDNHLVCLLAKKIITKIITLSAHLPKNTHLVCSSASQGAEASKVLTMVPCPSPAAQCKTVRPSSSCNWYVANFCDCWQQFFIYCGCGQDLLPVFNYNVPKPFFDLSHLVCKVFN